MPELNLLEWASKQPSWVQDALRRISTTAGFILSEEDRLAVLERVKHAAGGTGSPPICEAINAEHLSRCAESGPRAVLASIGPVQNVDRLAKSQQLRFAPAGVTLIFGENGSGKSGYARIQAEITGLDLDHIPFQVTDSSEQGQSRFAVGLQGVDKVSNNQVLSEGEQRALALACFLAEVAEDGDAYGLVIDDPVSSLDQRRMRLVAERLVAEAAKGRQVIVFTHNLVFFNEVVSEAARKGDKAPLIKMVVRRTEADGFGVIDEDIEPWLARSVSTRITDLRARAKALAGVTDLTGDHYRRQAKDFYSDLRETWERCVEELVLNKTIQRLVPDVMTMRLGGVIVSDEDYKTIYFAMKHVSERSGHDMPAGRDIPIPTPAEMVADVQTLEAFQADYKKRRDAAEKARKALHEPAKATLV